MHTKGLMASAFAVAILFVMTMAAPSRAASTPCTGPIGQVEINGDISAGAGCDLSGATVRGNVTVNPGGELTTKKGSSTVITGDVQSSDAEQIKLEGSTTVEGNLRLASTNPRFNAGVNNLVTEGTVKGNLQIEGGLAYVAVYRETVGGNLQILHTAGAIGGGALGLVEVIGDAVGGNVEVGNNSLPFDLENLLLVGETSVGGALKVYNNVEGRSFNQNVFAIFENHVGGNVEVLNNTKAFRGIGVSGNVVTNNLNCIGNSPSPGGEGNTAKHKLGQCELL